MPSVRAAHLSASSRLWRLVLALAFSALIGSGARIVRPMFRGVHLEMIVSLFVILPCVCLLLTLSQRRVPWRQAMLWLVLEVTGAVAGFTAGWSVVHGSLWDDLVGVMAAFLAIAVVASALLLIGWQHYRPPRSGPYCPACEYCLIGAPEDRCPECGRGFTLVELGVTREELMLP